MTNQDTIRSDSSHPRRLADPMLTITVPNWDKYNARKDRVNFTWSRFENNFFHDQMIFSLTDSQILLFQFLLCESSKKNSATIELRPSYIAAVRGKTVDEIISDFEGIVGAGLVTAESRHDAGRVTAYGSGDSTQSAALSRPTDRQTDIQTPEPKVMVSDLKTEIGAAVEVWNETLMHFGVDPRPLNPIQETILARAIQRLGFETVCLALEGQRHEEATETFKPRNFLSLERILQPDANGKSRWERFMNMALAERKRKAEDDEAYARALGRPWDDDLAPKAGTA